MFNNKLLKMGWIWNKNTKGETFMYKHPKHYYAVNFCWLCFLTRDIQPLSRLHCISFILILIDIRIWTRDQRLVNSTIIAFYLYSLSNWLLFASTDHQKDISTKRKFCHLSSFIKFCTITSFDNVLIDKHIIAYPNSLAKLY